MFDLVDLTQPLTAESLSYPGDRPAYRAEIVDIGEPGAQLTQFTGFDPHAGTHLDAPLHFDPTGADLARVPLRILPACIVRVPGIGSRAMTSLETSPGWPSCSARAGSTAPGPSATSQGSLT